MPYRPDFAQHQPDEPVGRYRDRVGRLFRGDDEAGLVLVRISANAEQVGGRLWWRRWGPTKDELWLSIMVDGRFEDSWVQADQIPDELAAYDAECFLHYGQRLRVEWTDAEESAQLRASHFG